MTGYQFKFYRVFGNIKYSHILPVIALSAQHTFQRRKVVISNKFMHGIAHQNQEVFFIGTHVIKNRLRRFYFRRGFRNGNSVIAALIFIEQINFVLEYKAQRVRGFDFHF